MMLIFQGLRFHKNEINASLRSPPTKLVYIPNAKFLTNPIVFMAFKVQTLAGVTRISRLNKYEIGDPNNHYK